ncbi:hypothetical protein [Desulfitobacterium chlororespirans]|uniref:Uncharacterized protein n=1 Tax=Desulfitobacterium chlororespirans DSM 11544 TaxID=1121395 RepID=A0A1M7U3P0_9FIRM|nr:hypothetical protein [Desulfitobacterium chlororespirans]SHN77524.1 hypothetical protein SAMN02745215_02898 [Desulfitobacterium chlororespirans DSM 11544]
MEDLMKETIANQAIEIQDLKNKVKQAEGLGNMWFQRMMKAESQLKRGEAPNDAKEEQA